MKGILKIRMNIGRELKRREGLGIPGECFLPLFHGVFPLLALEILILLNFSLSSGGCVSPSEKSRTTSGVRGGRSKRLEIAVKVLGSKVATALMTLKLWCFLRASKEMEDPLAWYGIGFGIGIGIGTLSVSVSEYRNDSCASVISAQSRKKDDKIRLIDMLNQR